MNKLSFALFLALGLSIPAFAAETTPVSNKGDVLEPSYAGVSTCEVTSGTGTAALLCATGEGVILDVMASSVAASDMLVFRDSATANTSSTVLFSTDLNGLNKYRRIYPRFTKGLSVNALVAPTAPGVASRPNWTIVYSQKLK